MSHDRQQREPVELVSDGVDPQTSPDQTHSNQAHASLAHADQADRDGSGQAVQRLSGAPHARDPHQEAGRSSPAQGAEERALLLDDTAVSNDDDLSDLARTLRAYPDVHPGADPGREMPQRVRIPDLGRRRSPIPQSTYSHSPLRQWMRDLVISVVASMLIITCLYQPVRVEGTSMQPRLHDQDRLFINKFVYHFERISRGDVVVFHYPRDPAKSYIKRVIALPGDDLRIFDGQVYVNGSRLAEPYVAPRYVDERSVPEQVIPPGDYWVMGDHRSISSDSRDFGPVSRPLIYGKAAFIYWPADGFGLVH